jgi:hypothetical protein
VVTGEGAVWREWTMNYPALNHAGRRPRLPHVICWQPRLLKLSDCLWCHALCPMRSARPPRAPPTRPSRVCPSPARVCLLCLSAPRFSTQTRQPSPSLPLCLSARENYRADEPSRRSLSSPRSRAASIRPRVHSTLDSAPPTSHRSITHGAHGRRALRPQLRRICGQDWRRVRKFALGRRACSRQGAVRISRRPH